MTRILKFTNYKAILLTWVIICAPSYTFAYEPDTTHRALSQEIIKVFSAYYPKLSLSSAEAELIEKGSVDEDSGIRALHHFYDSVYNRGLGDVQISAKEWANDTLEQASFFRPLAGAITGIFGAPSDYSWERAIYDYVWNDKSRGLEGLGHILHLVEDMAVPDHTRDDAHPPYADKMFHQASPYEHWADKWDKNAIAVAEEILKRREPPANCESLNSCFDSMATYSNNNFFSKDTISTKNYSLPKIYKIEKEFLDGAEELFAYWFDEAQNSYRLVRFERKRGEEEVFEPQFDDNKHVMSDYWSHLSKQAVLHGVGVVRLFFEEAEKERKNRVLLSRNKSIVDKMATVILGVLGAEPEETPPKIAEIPPSAFEPFLSTSEVRTEEFASESATSDVEQDGRESLEVELPSEPVQEDAVEPPTLDTAPKTNTLISIPQAGFGGGAPAPVASESAADTTGPSISFSISECDSSLSPDGCLLASTTVNLTWSSSDSDPARYIVECKVGGAACSGFDFASTTATSTVYTVPTNDSIYTFRAKAVDKTGNQGSEVTKTAEIFTRPVVINEIAWAGTATSSFDEWIELYNRASKTVSLSNWSLRAEDGVPYINLSGTIAAGGYYLIERSSNDTVSDIDGDLVVAFSGTGSGSGLSNSGEVLVLSRASTTIDQTPSCVSAWCNAGSATGFLTMERVDPDVSGTGSSNWGSHNGTVKNGKDAGGAALAGTARARNSLNYLITTGTNLTANKTLKKSKSPFIVKDGITVNSGLTLTIEPGAVIKFFDSESYLIGAGVIKANGTAADKIVFTSFKDDAYGGDLNADATSTSPAALDWRTIDIQGPDSEFDQTIIRYGGKWFSGVTFGRANLKVINTSISLKNSTIEEGGIYGVWLDNASGTIEGNAIKNNKNDNAAAGIYLTGGSPTITSNTFEGNKVGLKIEPDTLNAANISSVTNNTFTSNQNEAIRMVSSFPTFSSNTATSSGTNGILITGTQSTDYTFVANLPYVIEATYTVNSAKTLTINSGTVVKFKDNSAAIEVSGKMLANGTSASQIVFTSLADDGHGGDTNNNGSASSPQAGDWRSVSFIAGSATSTLDNVRIRYGGGFFAAAGAVRIDGSSHEIKDSTFEFNNFNALWLSGTGTTTVSNTVFRSNQTALKVESPHVFVNGGGNTADGNTTNSDPSGLVP